MRRSPLVPGPGSRRHQVHVCLRGPPGEACHRRGGQERQLNPQYHTQPLRNVPLNLVVMIYVT